MGQNREPVCQQHFLNSIETPPYEGKQFSIIILAALNYIEFMCVINFELKKQERLAVWVENYKKS